jgi:hypothetical protein
MMMTLFCTDGSRCQRTGCTENNQMCRHNQGCVEAIGKSKQDLWLEIESLRAQLAAAKLQWISAEGRLPDDKTPVLILVNNTIQIGALFWEKPNFEDTYKAFQYWDSPEGEGRDWEWNDITHWMPLPQPPENES